MKADASSGAPAYLGVLKSLYELINKEYDDGGFLPPSRVMCEEMNVNRGTYNKAVARLISEGLASSNRKGGTYIIPRHFRVLKVGLIIRGGVDCPFIGEMESFGESVKVLCEEKQNLQIIQASPMENLGRQALLHNIDKLLWYYPYASYVPAAKQLEEQGMSVLFVCPEGGSSDEDEELLASVPMVKSDSSQGLRIAAEYALQRGCAQPLYLGSEWAATSAGFPEVFGRAGVSFTGKECVAKSRLDEKWLGRLVVRNKIDVIITEGGASRQQRLFEALSLLPEDASQPAIIARNTGLLESVKRHYPRINLVGVIKEDTASLGREAARMMLCHVQTGMPLTTNLMEVSYITPQ